MKFLIKIIMKLQLILSSIEEYLMKKTQVLNFPIHKVANTTIDWKKLLPSEPYIIEVGAYTGNDTAYFAATFPKGKIVSFEPDLELFKQLFKKAQFWPNILCFPYAVAQRTKICTFYPSYGGSRASGSIKKPTGHLELSPEVIFPVGKKQSVVSVALDEFFFNESRKIDLLWIDAQGSELEVLKGASKCLEHVNLIFIEVSSSPLYSQGATAIRIFQFLISRGFSLLASDINLKSKRPLEHGNALFKKVTYRSH